MVFASALFTIIAPPVSASSATETRYDVERANATSSSPNVAPAAMNVGPFRMRRSGDATACAPLNPPTPTPVILRPLPAAPPSHTSRPYHGHQPTVQNPTMTIHRPHIDYRP